MSYVARLAFALLLSTFAACGGKSNASADDDEPAGKGGSGGGGTSGTGGSSGRASSAGAGGADQCRRFDDDYTASVKVSIANQTGAPIYLGQDMSTWTGGTLFEVADANGAVLPRLLACRAPCSAVRTEGAYGGDCELGTVPGAVMLQPNETLHTTWNGLFDGVVEMPAACVPRDIGNNTKVSCDQAKRSEPGTFTFSARAGSALECSPTAGFGGCSGSTCTPSSNGGCYIPSNLVSGPTHSAQATVVLDENYGIYPKPSPGQNAGAELPALADASAVLTVELIFTE